MFRRSLSSPSRDLETVKVESSMNFLSHGCVFNTAECLEAEYVEYVKQRVGHDRVFGVGPLCLLGLDRVGTVNRTSSCPLLLSWLDGCPERSVLYICFGSQKALTKEQCDALALGLEKSMTRFVWVVKKDPVPEGFEERVAGRGMVVRGWAPQLEVLRHVAVGGFLSHCGWNSVLEGLTSGTMILGWPMEADQFVNARLLVEDLDVAVRVCEGDGTVPDPDELGRVIGETMGESGREVGARAEEMQRKLVGSVTEGSSFADLERLFNELALL